MKTTKTVAWAVMVVGSCVLVGVILYVFHAGPSAEHSVTLTQAELNPPHGAARFDTPNHTFASILNAAFDGDAPTLVSAFDQPRRGSANRAQAGGSSDGDRARNTPCCRRAVWGGAAAKLVARADSCHRSTWT